jgi:hypothetical protein
MGPIDCLFNHLTCEFCCELRPDCCLHSATLWPIQWDAPAGIARRVSDNDAYGCGLFRFHRRTPKNSPPAAARISKGQGLCSQSRGKRVCCGLSFENRRPGFVTGPCLGHWALRLKPARRSPLTARTGRSMVPGNQRAPVFMTIVACGNCF